MNHHQNHCHHYQNHDLTVEGLLVHLIQDLQQENEQLQSMVLLILSHRLLQVLNKVHQQPFNS
jgi:hypothetical protein